MIKVYGSFQEGSFLALFSGVHTSRSIFWRKMLDCTSCSNALSMRCLSAEFGLAILRIRYAESL